MAEQSFGADRRSRRLRRRVRGGALGVAAAAAAIALTPAALPGGPIASAAVSPPTGGGAAPGAMRTVGYHGYEISAPASWPVYDLAADPTRCVLFNQHAVYLGSPGTEQRCPARAYGRTEAVLVAAAGQTRPATAPGPPRSSTRASRCSSRRALGSSSRATALVPARPRC